MAGATDAEQRNGTGFCPVGEAGAYEIAGRGRTGDTGGDDLIVGLGQFYGGEVSGGKRAGLCAAGWATTLSQYGDGSFSHMGAPVGGCC